MPILYNTRMTNNDTTKGNQAMLTVHYYDRNDVYQIAENIDPRNLQKYLNKFEVVFVDTTPHLNLN